MERADKIAIIVGGVLTAAIGVLAYFYRRTLNYQAKKFMGAKYITVDMLCASTVAKQRGITNTPDATSKANLEALIANILDPLVEKVGFIPSVNSGYRCAALNSAVGGASTSQHMTGQAVDLGGTKEQVVALFKAAVALGNYDQLILEKKNSYWVHISYNSSGNNRHVVYATKTGGKPYTNITSNPLINYLNFV